MPYQTSYWHHRQITFHYDDENFYKRCVDALRFVREAIRQKHLVVLDAPMDMDKWGHGVFYTSIKDLGCHFIRADGCMAGMQAQFGDGELFLPLRVPCRFAIIGHMVDASRLEGSSI